MAEQAAAALRHDPDPDLQPATLEGFGPIGPKLLAHLLCGAELTPFLIKTRRQEHRRVGRRPHRTLCHTPNKPKPSRYAKAASAPHRRCRHPIAHNHHLTWWSNGGRTDLDNLIGLCRKCHSLVHAGSLDLARASPLARAA